MQMQLLKNLHFVKLLVHSIKTMSVTELHS